MSRELKVRFPVWTLANARAMDELDDLLKAVIVLTDPDDGEKSLALFTNESLAERFIRDIGIPGAVAVTIESEASLREWLPEMPGNGVRHVSYNPTADPGRASPREPIPDLLARLGGPAND